MCGVLLAQWGLGVPECRGLVVWVLEGWGGGEGITCWLQVLIHIVVLLLLAGKGFLYLVPCLCSPEARQTLLKRPVAGAKLVWEPCQLSDLLCCC